jgi:hypothetical protein
MKNLKDVDVVGKFTNCGCIELDFRLKEFEILDPIIKQLNVHLDISDPNNLQELKEKVICEYFKIINQLECGT